MNAFKYFFCKQYYISASHKINKNSIRPTNTHTHTLILFTIYLIFFKNNLHFINYNINFAL